METEFKGTKGKWEYIPFSEDSNGYITIEIPMGQITVYNGHYPLNMLENKDKCIEISEANAKLIACAPEMLELLINISNANPNDLSWNYQACMSKAQQLIKKATE